MCRALENTQHVPCIREYSARAVHWRIFSMCRALENIQHVPCIREYSACAVH